MKAMRASRHAPFGTASDQGRRKRYYVHRVKAVHVCFGGYYDDWYSFSWKRPYLQAKYLCGATMNRPRLLLSPDCERELCPKCEDAS